LQARVEQAHQLVQTLDALLPLPEDAQVLRERVAHLLRLFAFERVLGLCYLLRQRAL
jgi:hypothetical protein